METFQPKGKYMIGYFTKGKYEYLKFTDDLEEARKIIKEKRAELKILNPNSETTYEAFEWNGKMHEHRYEL